MLGLSRPGGETIDTPSTDSIDASSPAESSLDASRVTTRRCREDSGASASSTALSALRRPAALALAAASPVGAGACSATAARRTSIATRGAVVLWMPPAAATGYQIQAMPTTQRCCKDSSRSAVRIALSYCTAFSLWPVSATARTNRANWARVPTVLPQKQRLYASLAMFNSGFDLTAVRTRNSSRCKSQKRRNTEARRCGSLGTRRGPVAAAPWRSALSLLRGRDQRAGGGNRNRGDGARPRADL